MDVGSVEDVCLFQFGWLCCLFQSAVDLFLDLLAGLFWLLSSSAANDDCSDVGSCSMISD